MLAWIAANLARVKGAEAIGIDPAPVMLCVARLRCSAKPDVNWRIGTAESLPMGDNWAG
jgi:ubiquinone/menaquinone biosynthesis C-methylase UbiE